MINKQAIAYRKVLLKYAYSFIIVELGLNIVSVMYT